jgi:hypothetical protein
MYIDDSFTTLAKSGLEYLIRNYIIPTPDKANPLICKAENKLTFGSNYMEKLPKDVDFGNFPFVIDVCYVGGVSLFS